LAKTYCSVCNKNIPAELRAKHIQEVHGVKKLRDGIFDDYFIDLEHPHEPGSD